MKTLSNLGLTTKIIGVGVLIVAGLVGVNYAVFLHGYKADAESALVERAAAFTAVADEAKAHASKLLASGAVNREELIAEAVREVKEGKSYRDTRFFKAIPVVVGWTTAQEAAKKEGLTFKVAAFDARNKENEPAPGSFREALLRDLEAGAKTKGQYTISRVDPATNTLHYMRAIRLDETCMGCHGDPQRLSVKDADGKPTGKDALGFKMENWPVGGTHGAYELQMPLGAMDAQVAGFLKTGLMYSVPLMLCGAFAFVLWLRGSLGKPIGRVVGTVERVARGDLTARLGIERGDEIGRLASSFDALMESLHGAIKEVSGAANDVAAASTEIAASSEEMSASVGEVARECAKAATAAGESGRVATEGGEVVQKTVTGMRGIERAVSESAQSVSALGARGEEIGKVIGVINDIADQTNLLALNAAIEAARAGEHGRGFAVVADEVRKLAERTTRATEEIAGSITSIQTETAAAVARMKEGTTEVQAGVQSAEGAGKSLEQIVSVARDVAGMVQAISAAAEEAGAGAGQSATAATELSAKAEQLRTMVSRFKLEGGAGPSAVAAVAAERPRRGRKGGDAIAAG
jgi:methyl-accepting chemotaxis protein